MKAKLATLLIFGVVIVAVRLIDQADGKIDFYLFNEIAELSQNAAGQMPTLDFHIATPTAAK